MTEWWKEAVIYQIYPRSFFDTSGNGIGDLRGVISKINYIKSLGVDAIWLSPFFTSPMKDMGYDVSDYRSVDPIFGTMDDFEHLISLAHQNDIKVLIDQVLSHSSNEHEAFVESQNRDSKKSDWYVWVDPKSDGSPPNNWLSVFGGSAWKYEPKRNQYYLHNFLPSQPDFNFHNQEVQDFALAMVKYWLDKGVDGFRLDTVNYYFHDKELRDNPPSPKQFKHPPTNPYYAQDQRYSINQKENLNFLKSFRELLDSYEDKTSVGEVGDSHRAIEIMKHYTKDSRLHMAYSFELLGKNFSSVHIKKTIDDFFNDNEGSWPCWSFSNHDVIRHLTRWDEHETQDFAKQSCALLLSLKGTLCIYQGEELGQTETNLEYEEIIDPPGLKFWPANKGRDGCRTPMVWKHDSAYGGFSKSKPWLPVKDNQLMKSVDLQENDINSTLNFYRNMIGIRKSNSALSKGKMIFIHDANNVLIYRRNFQGEEVICAFNFNKKAVSFSLNIEVKNKILIANCVTISGDSIKLEEYGFILLHAVETNEQEIQDSLVY